MRARTGKIARLPLAVREELNRRLLENEPGSKILPWLNGLEEVNAVLMQMPDPNTPGKTVGPIDDRNLSDWRAGGFADWMRRRAQLDDTREMAQWSMRLAKAGNGNLSEGAAQILGGQILEVLEGLSELKEAAGEQVPDAIRITAIAESIDQLTLALSRLRKGDHSKQKLELDRERLEQGAEALKLEREKFEMVACRKMLDEAVRRQAEQIANSNLSNADKIAAMRKAAFADVDALEASGEVKLPQ